MFDKIVAVMGGVKMALWGEHIFKNHVSSIIQFAMDPWLWGSKRSSWGNSLYNY